MTRKDHWEKVYRKRNVHELGWYEPHLRTSLKWIAELDLARDDPIIDIGGGASNLVDDLLDAGHQAITVLDISAEALRLARARLGERARKVTWIEGDVTVVELPEAHFRLWHDRAVFHFLTLPEQQARYRDRLLASLRPEGDLLIATFAPEAPAKCSGLPVQRYSADQLSDTMGKAFELRRYHKELHVTPGGVEQMYLICLMRRVA
jgi:ubiquinone/menaquinone biosynthesis C-methylase UbiE